MTSEAIAAIAYGAQNKVFEESRYIRKKEWDEYSLKQELDWFEKEINNYDPREDFKYSTKVVTLRPICQPTCQQNNRLTFELSTDDNNHEQTHECDMVSNIWLNIQLTSFNDSIIEQLYKCIIHLELGGSRIYDIDMVTNLFLSIVFKKKIIERDQYVRIPLILFELYPEHNLPIYLLKWHQAKIHLSRYDIPNQCHLVYDGLNFNNSRDKLDNCSKLSHNIIQTQFTGEESIKNNQRLRLAFNHITKILLIHIIEKDCHIEEISLSLNGGDPIVWEIEELLQINVNGHLIYVVPLVPNIKSIKDIRNMMKYFNLNGNGINFSRIDNAILKIITDLPDDYMFSLNVHAISLNQMQYVSGMTGLTWSR